MKFIRVHGRVVPVKQPGSIAGYRSNGKSLSNRGQINLENAKKFGGQVGAKAGAKIGALVGGLAPVLNALSKAAVTGKGRFTTKGVGFGLSLGVGFGALIGSIEGSKKAGDRFMAGAKKDYNKFVKLPNKRSQAK